MLSTLHIKNYALIDQLNVDFNNGFSIITGETGAGKSILLGGLSLVLGKRADLSQIKSKNEKCVIEATFDIARYNLKGLFTELDLDYDVQTIIRREILPSGKSRAFINDTPVTLDSLVALSSYLIDIHSQHQTQQLIQDEYQFQIIDALAGNKNSLEDYSTKLSQYKTILKGLDELTTSKAEMLKEYYYNSFLLNELSEINLDSINIEDLESQYETLNNVEEISERLGNTRGIISNENIGLSDQLNAIKQELSKISGYSQDYNTLYDRIQSIDIELNDILVEIEGLHEGLSTDPTALEKINSQLQIINNLFQKHAVDTTEELLEIKESLELKVANTENLDETIAKYEDELSELESKLNSVASKIHNARQKAIPQLINKLEIILDELGMPNAKFKIELSKTDSFNKNGKDALEFLFMANKGSSFSTLKKAASGGEMSRIMLAIKSILSEYMQLPTIMFDEIDTGVSGEISHKMGAIMKVMSGSMQVFAITHLPQIAAKGDAHFKVFKEDYNDITTTNLKRLNEEDRIVEIAHMLGGLNITESAIAHAKQLLN